MSMFGPKEGSWSVESKSDPRWNKEGRGFGLVCEGGPKEMQDWIEFCMKEYGKPPPDTYRSFMKD